jgi:hypothetical protein
MQAKYTQGHVCYSFLLSLGLNLHGRMGRGRLSRFFTLADRSGSNQVDDESLFFFLLSRDDSLTDGVHNSKKCDDYKFRTRGFFPCASFNSPSESLTP